MRKQQVTMFVSLLLLVVAASAQTPTQLDRVNVVRGTDDIRVEMTSKGTLTPKLSALDSPARVVVDLPETVMATGQKHITVGAAGVKDVRIGMDGQTHPSTRVVVDLDQACAYELTPGPAGKLVLTLHTNAVAKAAAATTTVATQSATKAEAPATKEVAKDSSPTDFVFVEPSYQAKSQASDVKKDDAAQRLGRPAHGSRPGSCRTVLRQDCRRIASGERSRCPGAEQPTPSRPRSISRLSRKLKPDKPLP